MDKLSSKEYETLVFGVASEKIDDENAAPAAAEIEDSAMMMARYVAMPIRRGRGSPNSHPLF